jgi:hypothetical protein
VIAGRQERGPGEQVGEFAERPDLFGEHPVGFAIGLGLPATGFVVLGRPLALLADTHVLADNAAVLPAGAGVIGTAARTAFPWHGKSSMWCKTRAAHRTPVLPPRAWAHAWGKYRVFLFSRTSKSIGGSRTGERRALFPVLVPFDVKCLLDDSPRRIP